MNLHNLRKSFQKRISTHSKSHSKGFTLIEMMIVVAIIAMIMGLVGTNVIRKFDEARVNATKIQIRQLGNALDDFRRVCGYYPTTDQGLNALIQAPSGGRQCKNYDPEGFLKGKKVPQDSWNNDYIYESDGNKYSIKSMGPEGKLDSPKVIDSDHLDD